MRSVYIVQLKVTDDNDRGVYYNDGFRVCDVTFLLVVTSVAGRIFSVTSLACRWFVPRKGKGMSGSKNNS